MSLGGSSGPEGPGSGSPKGDGRVSTPMSSWYEVPDGPELEAVKPFCAVQTILYGYSLHGTVCSAIVSWPDRSARCLSSRAYRRSLAKVP